jgi:hypothetical protein
VVSCPLFPLTTSSTAMSDYWHVHSLLPLPTADQVKGAGYSECEVETNAVALQVETSAVALELKTDAANLELETSL